MKSIIQIISQLTDDIPENPPCYADYRRVGQAVNRASLSGKTDYIACQTHGQTLYEICYSVESLILEDVGSSVRSNLDPYKWMEINQ